jgi:serine/threonine protein kinase
MSSSCPLLLSLRSFILHSSTSKLNSPSLHLQAPELHCREPIYGPEVDVYSFGISMWVICEGTGIHPYQNVPLLSFTDFVLEGGRPQSLPLELDLPVELTSLMRSCWDSDPKQRPSFSQILIQLQEIKQQVHS